MWEISCFSYKYTEAWYNKMLPGHFTQGYNLLKSNRNGTAISREKTKCWQVSRQYNRKTRLTKKKVNNLKFEEAIKRMGDTTKIAFDHG